jgi:tetrapyrrole methylase family protein/MazG family protein
VLLHILLQAQIATEEGEFRLSDVVCHVNRKIVYRHPHVFGGLEVDGVAEVLVNWEMLKQQEKEQRLEAPSPLDGIPHAMPALARAQSIQRHVERSEAPQGRAADLAAQVRASLDHLAAQPVPVEAGLLLGQMLFALADLARILGTDAESALREANARFEERFRRTGEIGSGSEVEEGTEARDRG